MSENLSSVLKSFATSQNRGLNIIEKAIKVHEDAKLSFSDAAEEIGVSKSALIRGAHAVAEQRPVGVNGRPELLSEEETEEFIDRVNQKLDSDEPLTYVVARQMACDVWNNHHQNMLNRRPKFSDGWIRDIFVKHDIDMTSPRRVEKERFLSADQVKQFFTDFRKLKADYDVPDCLVFNADETRVDGEKARTKCAKKRGSRKPCVPLDDEDDQMTLLLTIGAMGAFFRPLVIFDVLTDPRLSDANKSFYDRSGTKSGFINQVILNNTVELSFIQQLNDYRKRTKTEDRYAILLLDNHGSRNQLNSSKLFEQHKLILLSFPGHASALLQPLDMQPNGVFKQVYRKKKERYIAQMISGQGCV